MFDQNWLKRYMMQNRPKGSQVEYPRSRGALDQKERFPELTVNTHQPQGFGDEGVVPTQGTATSSGCAGLGDIGGLGRSLS